MSHLPIVALNPRASSMLPLESPDSVDLSCAGSPPSAGFASAKPSAVLDQFVSGPSTSNQFVLDSLKATPSRLQNHSDGLPPAVPRNAKEDAAFKEILRGGLDPKTDLPYPSIPLTELNISPAEKSVATYLENKYTDPEQAPVFQYQRKQIDGEWYSELLGSYKDTIETFVLNKDGERIGHTLDSPQTDGLVEIPDATSIHGRK